VVVATSTESQQAAMAGLAGTIALALALLLLLLLPLRRAVRFRPGDALRYA
jgi:type IV secretory pathway component VirB8